MHRCSVKTYVALREGCTALGEVDLIGPGTLYPTNDKLVGDVLDPCGLVGVDIALVNDTLNLILGPAQPAFFKIV